MQKSGHIVYKGVNWIHNENIRSNGLEGNQLGTQMVLKGVSWVHNTRIRSYGLQMSQ